MWVEVSANPQFGMATIWDADILIWASTQITEALDRQAHPNRTIQLSSVQSSPIHPPDDRRSRLHAAARRLGAAHAYGRPHQHPRPMGKKKFASFHWLESWTETIDEATGEPTGMTITLARLAL